MVRLNKGISKLFGMLFFLSLFSSAQAALITIDDAEGLITDDSGVIYTSGQILQDAAGISWEYVGFYHVGMPNESWSLGTTPTNYSALEWAERLYAVELYEQANGIQVNDPLSADIDAYLSSLSLSLATSILNLQGLVTHTAFYDVSFMNGDRDTFCGVVNGIATTNLDHPVCDIPILNGSIFSWDENYTFDANGNDIYDSFGDVSPFVQDHVSYDPSTAFTEYTYVFKRVTDVSEPQTYLIMMLGLGALMLRRKFS